MRIVVILSDAGAHPEIKAEMERISARSRAERLRTLATLGWLALHPQKPDPVERSSSTPIEQERGPSENPLIRIRHQLKKSLI